MRCDGIGDINRAAGRTEASERSEANMHRVNTGSTPALPLASEYRGSKKGHLKAFARLYGPKTPIQQDPYYPSAKTPSKPWRNPKAR